MVLVNVIDLMNAMMYNSMYDVDERIITFLN